MRSERILPCAHARHVHIEYKIEQKWGFGKMGEWEEHADKSPTTSADGRPACDLFPYEGIRSQQVLLLLPSHKPKMTSAQGYRPTSSDRMPNIVYAQ